MRFLVCICLIIIINITNTVCPYHCTELDYKGFSMENNGYLLNNI